MSYLVKVLLFTTIVVSVVTTTYHKGQMFERPKSKSNVKEKLTYFGKSTGKNVEVKKHHRQIHVIKGTRVEDIRDWSMTVAFLVDNDDYLCSGTLISDLHVLTCAHCVNICYHQPGKCGQKAADTLKVRVGFRDLTTADVTNTRETFRVQTYFVPNGFDCCNETIFNTRGRDIAVLVLSKRIPKVFFDNKYARIVNLSDTENWPKYKELKFAGYGDDENKNFRILRYGSAAYMNQDTCQEKRIEDFNARNYLGVRSIPQDVMCLTNENTGFSGVGDSGGPVFFEYPTGSQRYFVVGLLTGPGYRRYPKDDDEVGGIAVRVDPYHKWIKSIIGEKIVICLV